MRGQRFLSRSGIFVMAGIFIIMLGVVDWVSGYELQFFVFYFIPISCAAWFCYQSQTYTIVLLSTGVWYAADLLSGPHYTHFAYGIWNTIIRLVSFLVLAFTVMRIRRFLDSARKISDDLQKALSEVKTLTGLLPICSSCKKIRNDQGYWQQMEEYISKHSDAKFSHGLCQECAGKMLREAGIES
jgi:hypothetical protein